MTLGAMRSGVAFQQLVSTGVTAGIALATATVTLLVSPTLGALALAAVALLAVGLARAVVLPSHRLGRVLQRESRSLQSVLSDSVSSLRLVRAHDAAAVWESQLELAFADTRTAQLSFAQRTASVSAVTTSGLAVGGATLVAASMLLELDPATTVLVLVLIARLTASVRSLAQSGASLVNCLPAVGDLSRLTLAAVAQREAINCAGPPRRRERAHAPPSVQLSEVTYAYPSDSDNVVRLDLRIASGKVTALAGPSGAGKSTAADLVLGLLRPSTGQVLVDGRPLGDEDLGWWRRQIGYVPQESVMVPGTLRENLIWSAGRAVTDDECRAALTQVSADFTLLLPHGLDTRLGDDGLRLSGGERQRISLARALLRRPRLVVLDEATSALDDATEATVLAWMRSLTPSATVLLVAHRKSSLLAADHVVRLTGRSD